jgi:hypothetical protein
MNLVILLLVLMLTRWVPESTQWLRREPNLGCSLPYCSLCFPWLARLAFVCFAYRIPQNQDSTRLELFQPGLESKI